MKDKKILILSLAIPSLFISLIVFRQFLENTFRGPVMYRYFYSSVSTITMLIQLSLILVSFLFALHILSNRKRYNSIITTLSFIFSSSVFLYISTMLLISVIEGIN